MIRWLNQQGTQRGIIRLLSALIVLKYGIDSEIAVNLIAGAMAVVGLHDAVTEG